MKSLDREEEEEEEVEEEEEEEVEEEEEEEVEEENAGSASDFDERHSTGGFELPTCNNVHKIIVLGSTSAASRLYNSISSVDVIRRRARCRRRPPPTITAATITTTTIIIITTTTASAAPFSLFPRRRSNQFSILRVCLF
ncbi:histone H3.v1-like [Vespa crabro]|uniref:histone H3.v1-like n=1 Tax=Vespa crabro TaxID=7445 RepID=UPI001EFFFBA3|nr:histone H3.v1-like [Vespa crabro]